MNATARSPLFTVIIPTHSHASTLGWAIRSVLDQTMSEFDLFVVGDGVDDATRTVVAEFDDQRIHFEEVPKSASRAEPVRDRILRASSAACAAYLGDDDLMLPNHLEIMSEFVDETDFVHPLPITILPDHSLFVRPTDLSIADCRRWHLHPSRNAVSLSGVVHRLDAYRTLARGWQEAPAGRQSDHFMWESWFRTDGLRFRTNLKLTILKFDSVVRPSLTPREREEEVAAWFERSRRPEFTQWLEDEVTRALLQSASLERVMGDSARDELKVLKRDLELTRKERGEAVESFSTIEKQITAMQSTRTWRLHEAVTRLLRRTARER